jgi:hypothetical protein
VALLHYQPAVALQPDGSQVAGVVCRSGQSPLDSPTLMPTTAESAAESAASAASRLPTRIAQPVPSPRRTRFLLVALVLGLVAGAIAAAYWWRSPQRLAVPTVSPSDLPEQQPIAINQILRVGKAASPLQLLPQPGQGVSASEMPSQLPVGNLSPDTIVQVVGYWSNPDQGPWVKVKVCSASAIAASTNLQSGDAGWLLESILAQHSTAPTSLPEEEMGPCIRSAPIQPLQTSTPPG